MAMSSQQQIARQPDILSLIFAHAAPRERDRRASIGRRTLASAARASRAFLDPATRALWMHIDTMRPLVMLLSGAEPVLNEPKKDPVHDYPDDEIEMYAEYSWMLLDAISHDDWTRFTRYAAYVRIVDPEARENISIVDDPEWPHQTSSIDPSVFFRLSRMSEGKPLLPNLKELSWTQRSLSDTGMLTVIPPKLRWLRIEARDHDMAGHQYTSLRNGNTPRRRDYVYRMLLEEVLRMAPEVAYLVLDGLSHPVALPPLAKYAHLCMLDITHSFYNTDINVDDIVVALARVPTLTRLRMRVQRCEELGTDLPHLEELGLTEWGNAEECTPSLLAALDCPSLRKLELELGTADSGAQLLARITDLALPTAFEGLRALTLHRNIALPGPRAQNPNAETTSISTLLEPLAALDALEELALVSTSTPMGCSDADMRALTQHWPKLHVFAARFLPAVPAMSDANLTAASLLHVARGWPTLTVLCIPVLQGAAPASEAEIPTHMHLRQLRVTRGVHTKDPSSLAKFIFTVFPRFSLRASPLELSIGSGDADPDCWTSCKTWRLVLDRAQTVRAQVHRGYFAQHKQPLVL